eukprot:m.162216 g.162216  ORF g.162216 m.162216 type:complete len:80 (-) comp14370_c1_seq1:53-292(-)
MSCCMCELLTPRGHTPPLLLLYFCTQHGRLLVLYSMQLHAQSLACYTLSTGLLEHTRTFTTTYTCTRTHTHTFTTTHTY